VEATSAPVAPQPKSPDKPTSQFQGKRVLAVDDAPDNLTLIQMYLRSTGAKLTSVDGGQAAIDEVQKEDFDLILMDVQMPGLDGHETTRKIRDLGFRGPIIALTAHAIGIEHDKCLESGCTHTLTKPIGRTALIEEMSRFI
jgi:CheY-like chemotaxis protein